ncbi:MAG TPA: RNA methyltransferase [Acidimicrobiales bacterium]|nr:RNA methyltransferase [Acidimicrobiales bacterium]
MGAPSPLGARHQKVTRLRRLLGQRSTRLREGAFAIEGETLVAEALDAGLALEAVFVAAGCVPLPAVAARAAERGYRVHTLAAGVLERISSTVHPQPVVAVAPSCDVALERVAGSSPVVVCVDVRDPGNAGNIARGAEAAGAGAIVFCAGSVDPFNPKTVRSSAGSLFHVPVVSGGDPVEVLEHMGAWGYERLGTVASGGEPYDEVSFAGPTAVVVGNEAHGLPPAIGDLLDRHVTIPMAGRTESLNVSMASALICFEALRQRRHAAPLGPSR